MKDNRSTEIKVGVTVIIGIIIFIWIFGWAKNFSLTPSEKILKVKFDNVAGLEIGDNVTVNGVRKGIVEDFDINGEYVIVSLSLSNDIKLKKDATFAVSMLDLMGGKRVDIKPGTAPEEINYDEIQTGVFYSDIPSVLSMLGTVQEDLFVTIKDIRITLSSLNNYLTDKQLNNDIKTSMSNLNEITGKLNLMINENRNNLKQLTSNSVELTEEAKNFIRDNKENINSSFKDLKLILEKTDTLLVKINNFADEIKNKENTFGKILYDEEVYKNLSQSLTQLNELTKIIIEQLKGDGFKVDADIF
jgi:phospholipid/cholesterol/gamma-HCH transport system substrate-binding protein